MTIPNNVIEFIIDRKDREKTAKFTTFHHMTLPKGTKLQFGGKNLTDEEWSTVIKILNDIIPGYGDPDIKSDFSNRIHYANTVCSDLEKILAVKTDIPIKISFVYRNPSDSTVNYDLSQMTLYKIALPLGISMYFITDKYMSCEDHERTQNIVETMHWDKNWGTEHGGTEWFDNFAALFEHEMWNALGILVHVMPISYVFRLKAD